MTDISSQDTVLVVDDQPANLKVLLKVLLKADFHILIANSGERALQLVSRKLPDIILLDVMMPGINGFETCRRLKADPATTAIPVIFMTALNSLDDELHGFEAGGVDYITKPFHQQKVLARLRAHLTIRRQQLIILEKKVQLERALLEIKQLSGILPICCRCKKVRDDNGYWKQVEQYISEHSDAEFTHGFCPDCYEEEIDRIAAYKKNLAEQKNDTECQHLP
ncbi:MAG: response regulator [Proteobacteria bacterium]|nr:response regulator [Pseudomonadota bacterium]MBU1138227.1 response regulator [Pseudomonadota bacterium]MBU1234433.1 response regulator [Pseudomonadota bacterium]MBU1418619.1 response regulator [Pseudomonadota bacterium]MBU1455812.1 response regulator [Pseudomonadota bacterium]